MKRKMSTLKQAVQAARHDATLDTALNQLDGCELGSLAWHEAKAKIFRALPVSTDRSYEVRDLIQALFYIDARDCWRRRSDR
jgi:hypothetical protein